MARLGRDDLELNCNLIPYATKTIPGTGHDTFKYHKSTFKIIKLPHAIDAFQICLFALSLDTYQQGARIDEFHGWFQVMVLPVDWKSKAFT